MNRLSILSKISRKIWRELTWSQEHCSRKFVLGSAEAMVCLLLPVCMGLKSDNHCLVFTAEGLRLLRLLRLWLFFCPCPVFSFSSCFSLLFSFFVTLSRSAFSSFFVTVPWIQVPFLTVSVGVQDVTRCDPRLEMPRPLRRVPRLEGAVKGTARSLDSRRSHDSTVSGATL